MALKFRPRKKIPRKSILIIGSIAAIVIAWLIFGGSERGGSKSQRIVTVETGTVEDVVTAQGKLEPKEYVDVGAQVSGQIKKLHVDIGDNVKKGDLLAEIDPRIYQAKLDQDTALLHSLEAQVNAQKAALVLSEQEQARNETMIKTKAISKSAYDQGKSTLDQDKAKLQSLEAQVEQTNSSLNADRTNLDYTKIYSPMDGTVTTLPVREGNTINSVQSAPTLMQVANLDVMTDRAQVAEADISRLKPDTDAYFSTLGDLERKFNGKVRLIQPSPEVLNNVVLFDVLIDADNKDRVLMDGMNTEVFFVLGRAENVPLLPMEALGKRLQNQDNESGKAYSVRVVGQSEPVTIHTGLADRAHIEIRDGLKVGDKVIVPSHDAPAGNNGGRGMGRGPRL